MVSLGCFDVLHNFRAFFIKQLIAFAKVTTKHQLAFSLFLVPFCVNRDSKPTKPVRLRRKIKKNIPGFKHRLITVAERIKTFKEILTSANVKNGGKTRDHVVVLFESVCPGFIQFSRVLKNPAF